MDDRKTLFFSSCCRQRPGCPVLYGYLDGNAASVRLERRAVQMTAPNSAPPMTNIGSQMRSWSRSTIRPAKPRSDSRTKAIQPRASATRRRTVLTCGMLKVSATKTPSTQQTMTNQSYATRHAEDMNRSYMARPPGKPKGHPSAHHRCGAPNRTHQAQVA